MTTLHHRPFSIVVAAATEKLGIGAQGKLPWVCPKDMQHFRELTSSTVQKDRYNAVIMGRKTWDSLPLRYRPLPNRLNIILSRQAPPSPPSTPHPVVIYCSSLDQALATLSKRADVDKLFVIGGGQVYHDAIQHECCREIHMTYFHTIPPLMDTFFPNPVSHGFRLISRSALLEQPAPQPPSLFFEYRIYNRNNNGH